MVRSWAHWTLLRRARSRLRRRPFTEGAAHAMRSEIKAAIALLEWTAHRGLTLAGLTQADIDIWLTSGNGAAAYAASEFLRWARDRRLAGQVAIPGRPRRSSPAALTDDERWEHLRRCLSDTSLPPDVRAVGALILLYGLTGTRVTLLRTQDIHHDGPDIWLALGTARLRVVPAVAELVRRQQQAAAGAPGGWLFPGRQAGTHISTSLHRKLAQHGLPALDHARAAALISLATDVPAAVLASLLGIHIDTANSWARHAGADWNAYIGARAHACARDQAWRPQGEP
jgi:hypothetical protein